MEEPRAPVRTTRRIARVSLRILPNGLDGSAVGQKHMVCNTKNIRQIELESWRHIPIDVPVPDDVWDWTTPVELAPNVVVELCLTLSSTPDTSRPLTVVVSTSRGHRAVRVVHLGG